MYKWHFLKLARNAHKSPRLNWGVSNYPKAENRAINGVLNVINGGLGVLSRVMLSLSKHFVTFRQAQCDKSKVGCE